MKNFSFAKAFTLGTLLCLALPVACGDDDDSSSPNTGGTANTGGEPASEAGAGGAAPAMLPPGLSATASTKMCGGDSCASVKVLPAPSLYIDSCCDATDGCGVNTGFFSLVGAQFKDACQSQAQAGDPSDSCAPVTGLKVPFEMAGTTVMVPLDPFAGCCRTDGTCGVVIDNVTSSGGKLPIANMNLGCVDATAFTGKAAVKCSGETGMGGAGGMSSGGADAGGAPATPAGGAGGAGGAQ